MTEATYDYYIWLSSYVDPENTSSFLLRKLFDTPFRWSIYSDKNRAMDGLELRHLYVSECTDCSSTDFIFSDRPECTTLEMLVALAHRIDSDIMYGYSEDEDTTPQWFWLMLSNLGLAYYTDEIYDSITVEEILKKFLDRAYKKNGVGSIFYTTSQDIDFTQTELWYQTNIYLNEHYFYEKEKHYYA